MTRRPKLSRLRESAPQILPSLLLCDFGNLEREIRQLEEAGIRALHLDVMDGVFVPNFTYGMTIVEAVRGLTDLLLDVHLMISRPEAYVKHFCDAGADVLTFHAEAVSDPRPLLKQIRSLGVASGLAIKPKTSVASVASYMDECDLALVMSIEPGFGGQSFEPDNLVKLSEIREQVGPEVCLEIDGGINPTTIQDCVEGGAECLVVGSAIFREADYGEAIENLQCLMMANRE